MIQRKNKVDIYGSPVFAPDYSAPVQAAELCTNSHEHSKYIRYRCFVTIFTLVCCSLHFSILTTSPSCSLSKLLLQYGLQHKFTDICIAQSILFHAECTQYFIR
jgi:hypothetical protein